MILDIDMGNTRIKWRINDVDGRQWRQGACSAIADMLVDLSPLRHLLRRVRVSCVGREELLVTLDEWLHRQDLPPCERARPTATLGGVRNGYTDHRQLGVDRWLALCAAYRLVSGACVVVDAGSAVTLDVVDATGLHHGGFIVPGLRLLKASLRSGTERVAFTEAEVGTEYDKTCGLGLGDSTQVAVDHGTLFMLTAMVEKAVRDHCAGVPGACTLVLTGGDAPILAGKLSIPHRVVPDLVFQGIEIALP